VATPAGIVSPVDAASLSPEANGGAQNTAALQAADRTVVTGQNPASSGPLVAALLEKLA
jgi:hypothetical protein